MVLAKHKLKDFMHFSHEHNTITVRKDCKDFGANLLPELKHCIYTYFMKINPTTTANLPNIKDYELTFEVSGLGFLFADMLTDSFSYMHPIFTVANGEFKQYFHNDKMTWAKTHQFDFDKYEKDCRNYHAKNIIVLKDIANGKPTKGTVKKFIEIANKFHWWYSYMNTQFEMNPFDKLSKFKDVAREWINEILVYENCYLNILLQKLSKQFGVSVVGLNNYKSAELVQLFDGKRVDKEELEKRQYGVATFDGNNIQYFVGEIAKGFIQNAENQSTAETDLRGQVSNKAKLSQIEGIVRVINVDYSNISAMNKAIDEMQKGEILVAKFTAPELVGAFSKAKAIVTDLGGMLSHASIVARELNIPCVVGTRNASKLLKTGDSIKINLITGEIYYEQ